MKFYRALAVLVASLAACSPAPTPSPDTGVTLDSAVTPDSASNDSPAPQDVASATDTGVTADTGVSSDALRCGASMSICGPSQVCCVATGPTSPERCVDATMCTTWRCDATSQCPVGRMCCTDGIQSTCQTAGGTCGFRACRTAADCEGRDQCCPFGADQRRCGSC